MSKFIFPYGIRFQEDGRVETFPAAEIFIVGRGKKGIRALFHIDSGATTSIMPSGDADVLGINVEKGKKIFVRGISGDPLVGYQHDVVMQIERMKIRVNVIFVADILVPRILGREDIFSRFAILFDESKGNTALLDAVKERKSIDVLYAPSAA